MTVNTGPVRAVLLHQQPTTTGGPTSTDDATAENEPGWLFTKPNGAPLNEHALRQLCDQGAARAGVNLPIPSFRNRSVTDLHGLPRVGS